MNLVKTISASINNFTQRVIKFYRFGKDDVQTALEYGPYGVDSNPIAGMIAIYGPTTDKGETTIIGYLNKNQKASPGEMRIFATNADGVEKFYIWQKADGTCEIGGAGNFSVKFNELKTEFDKLKTDFNNLVTKYNSHVHVLTLTVGTGTAAPTVTTQTANTSNIDAAKNDKIKTI
jgi:hypothetical protein